MEMDKALYQGYTNSAAPRAAAGNGPGNGAAALLQPEVRRCLARAGLDANGIVI